MLTIFTLELFSRSSHLSKPTDFRKRSDLNSKINDHTTEDKVTQEMSKEKYEKMENYIMLFPILVTLLAIIIMSILYKLFY